MSGLREFVDVLRLDRLRRRIKSFEIAQALGIAAQTLSGWETHRAIPADSNLRRWASLLEIEVPAGVRGFDDSPADCGTTGGYQRHRRAKETTCSPCRAAWAEYMRDFHRARRQAAVSPP